MEELQSEKFCEKFPTLHMCRLKEELTGSLVELQYLLQDGNQFISHVLSMSSGMNVGAQASGAAQEVQKRKSAFVRFGKRSAPMEDDEIVRKRAGLWSIVLEA